MSGSGNGTDFGHIVAMLGDVLDGQREIRGVLNDHTRVLNEHTLKLAEHSRDIADLTSQVHFLRDAVTDYHASVVGHGVLISELDSRVRRIEHHLDLPPAVCRPISPCPPPRLTCGLASCGAISLTVCPIRVSSRAQ